MDNQPGNGAPNNSPEDFSKEPRDFDDSANALWYLYGKEAKGHDEARMQNLRDDMDGLLIFVCIGYQPMTSQLDIILALGWFVLCSSHCVRGPKDPGLRSEPGSAISLLPISNRSDSCSDISTNCVDRYRGTP